MEWLKVFWFNTICEEVGKNERGRHRINLMYQIFILTRPIHSFKSEIQYEKF
jgi:hypothetical protein